MRIGLTILILASLGASCRTIPPVPNRGFSFDDRELPNLMDINQGKFSAPARGLNPKYSLHRFANRRIL